MRRYVPDIGRTFQLEGWQFIAQGLSPAIMIIFIDRPSDPRETFWSVESGGAVPELAPEQIRERIQDKEAKLGKYLNKCSKAWLLIVEDGFTLSSYFVISDEVKKQVYKSSFDRIFLFRNFICEAIELNIEP